MDKSIIDGKKIFTAANVRIIHPVFLQIAENLSRIDGINYIKIFKYKIQASTLLSDNGQRTPLLRTHKKKVLALQLLIDVEEKTIEFTSIESDRKGAGREMVAAVVDATPNDWTSGIAKNWMNEFFRKMMEEMPRIQALGRIETGRKYSRISLRGI